MFRCAWCRRMLPTEDFYAMTGPRGVQRICKRCQNQYRKGGKLRVRNERNRDILRHLRRDPSKPL